jgi:hypothetical protein
MEPVETSAWWWPHPINRKERAMPSGGSSTVNVNTDPVTVNADSSVQVMGLDKIGITATLAPSPLKTESKQELILPQPLKTDSKIEASADITSDSKSALAVDLKPVALDVCLNSSSKLPTGEIHQPFSFHIGLTLFGMEMFGVNFGGDSRITLQDLPKKPSIDWPAQQNAAWVMPSSERPAAAAHEHGGLRVRVK